MFWRKISSDRQGDIAPLRKIAVDKYYNKVQKEYASSDGYKYLDNCAIGSIRVLAVDADKVDNTFDLQGRKAQMLQKGQLYIQNGKRVMDR